MAQTALNQRVTCLTGYPATSLVKRLCPLGANKALLGWYNGSSSTATITSATLIFLPKKDNLAITM